MNTDRIESVASSRSPTGRKTTTAGGLRDTRRAVFGEGAAFLYTYNSTSRHERRGELFLVLRGGAREREAGEAVNQV